MEDSSEAQESDNKRKVHISVFKKLFNYAKIMKNKDWIEASL